jgi:protein TonB
MKENIFEKSLIVTGKPRQISRVKWFFLLTAFTYVTAVAGIIVASILLINPQLAEAVQSVSLVAPPPSPPPPPPPPAGGKQSTVAKVPKKVIVPVGFVPPTVTPKSLPPTTAALPEVGAPGEIVGGVPGGVPGGVIGGVPGGVVGGVLGSTGSVAAPVEPVPPPKVEAPPPTPPRPVSRGVLQGNAIRRAQPKYPLLARRARLQGIVEVHIVVDEQGNVISAEAVSGHPLLQQAALETARQWKFRPTLLNGQPIKVAGILQFHFMAKEGAIG